MIRLLMIALLGFISTAYGSERSLPESMYFEQAESIYVPPDSFGLEILTDLSIGDEMRLKWKNGSWETMIFEGYSISGDGYILSVRRTKYEHKVGSTPGSNTPDLELSPRAQNTSQSPGESGQANNSEGPGDTRGIDGAIGSAGVATAIYGLSEALPYKDEIIEAYRAINEMDGKIQGHRDHIKSVKLKVHGKVKELELELKEGSKSIDPDIFKIPGVSEVYILPDTSHLDLGSYQWKSSEKSFVRNANYVRDQLVGADIKDDIDQTLFDIGKQSLLYADEKSARYHQFESKVYLEIAEFAADALVGLDPVSGTARSVYEFFSGLNVITGDELTTTERYLAGVGIFTAGYAAKATKLYKLGKGIAQFVGKATMRTYRGAGRMLQKTGHGYEIVSGSSIRKINFTSNLNPGWGLTKKHLGKYLFSRQSRSSLSRVDPSGNPDKWMQEMMDLMQRKPNFTSKKGFLEIRGEFPKSDGSGYYQLGVKLKERADGSFDLVKLLTKQQ